MKIVSCAWNVSYEKLQEDLGGLTWKKVKYVWDMYSEGWVS